MTLHAGPVSARLAYRWLRRQRRMYHDVYLRVEWTPTRPATQIPLHDGREMPDFLSELPDDTHEALLDFDANCKTLDSQSGLWAVRTRCWRGREDMPPKRRHVEDWDADRARGLLYARRLAALLRAAARDGVALRVRGDSA